MGRKALPTNVHELRGTVQPCRAVEEPQFEIVEQFPIPPRRLNVEGCAMWNDLGPQLVATNVLRVVDLYVLENLCYAWQRYCAKAEAGMDIAAADWTALKAFYSELGMTPASRRKVSSDEGKKNKGNKYASQGKRPA